MQPTESTLTPARKCLSVSQFTARVKKLLDEDIGEVWIQGEISSFKPSAAGHLYFNLKDSGAVLMCAMFRNQNGRIKFALKDGIEVIAHGRISVYAPRGQYQLIVDHLEPVGFGALQLAFEQLKAKLQAEGLFESSKKRPLPAHPQKIAIITSPTGAALQDMLNILRRRNSGIKILIVPTLVQGDEAPSQIVRALDLVNQYELSDVIVLARGGGSLEDLWCFNDEQVVRAVAASKIPTISAIGHEVDFTLCDFAADLRAPTPSAAAELVSKSKLEMLDSLISMSRRIALSMAGRVTKSKALLLQLENRLISPSEKLVLSRKRISEYDIRLRHLMEVKLPEYRQMIDDLHVRLNHTQEKRLFDIHARLNTFAGQLDALSPLKVLGRGYTLTKDSVTGVLLKKVEDAKSGRLVTIVFKDGQAQSRIL